MANLYIFGHPELNNDSFMNKVILETARSLLTSDDMIWKLNDKGDTSVADKSNEFTIHTPFAIDSLQQQVEKFDNVILIFPYHWYGMPNLLKRFIDELFTYEWSYSPSGKMALQGKNLYLLTTLGATEESHQRGGFNHYSVEETLLPCRLTANISQMNFMQPGVIYGDSTLWALLWDKITLDNRDQFLAEQRARIHKEALNYFTAMKEQRLAIIPLQQII